VPPFTGLGRVELARLAAHLEPVDVEPGADVIRQGTPAPACTSSSAGCSPCSSRRHRAR